MTLAGVQASGLENLNGELFGMKVIGGLHRNNFDLCRVNIIRLHVPSSDITWTRLPPPPWVPDPRWLCIWDRVVSFLSLV